MSFCLTFEGKFSTTQARDEAIMVALNVAKMSRYPILPALSSAIDLCDAGCGVILVFEQLAKDKDEQIEIIREHMKADRLQLEDEGIASTSFKGVTEFMKTLPSQIDWNAVRNDLLEISKFFLARSHSMIILFLDGFAVESQQFHAILEHPSRACESYHDESDGLDEDGDNEMGDD